MDINENASVAKLLTEIIIWLSFCLAVYMGGYLLPYLDKTIYPEFGICLILYASAGTVIMTIKHHHPPPTIKMMTGKIDLAWGIKNLYWALWWPTYLKNGQ